jgi:hypothetical protein
MNRQRLPNRRNCETFEFDLENMRFTASYGRDEFGEIREVFLSGGKSGSLAESITCTASTLISVARQYGISAQVLRHSIPRNPDGSAMCPVGFILDDMVKG